MSTRRLFLVAAAVTTAAGVVFTARLMTLPFSSQPAPGKAVASVERRTAYPVSIPASGPDAPRGDASNHDGGFPSPVIKSPPSASGHRPDNSSIPRIQSIPSEDGNPGTSEGRTFSGVREARRGPVSRASSNPLALTEPRLPVAFQEVPAGSILLTPAQAAGAENIQEQFLDETGSGTADPSTLAYLEKWHRSQPLADQHLRAAIGAQAFMRWQAEAYLQAKSQSSAPTATDR